MLLEAQIKVQHGWLGLEPVLERDRHLQAAEDGVGGWWLPACPVQGRQGFRQGRWHHVAAEQHGHLLAPPLLLKKLRVVPACSCMGHNPVPGQELANLSLS